MTNLRELSSLVLFGWEASAISSANPAHGELLNMPEYDVVRLQLRLRPRWAFLRWPACHSGRCSYFSASLVQCTRIAKCERRMQNTFTRRTRRLRSHAGGTEQPSRSKTVPATKEQRRRRSKKSISSASVSGCSGASGKENVPGNQELPRSTLGPATPSHTTSAAQPAAVAAAPHIGTDMQLELSGSAVLSFLTLHARCLGAIRCVCAHYMKLCRYPICRTITTKALSRGSRSLYSAACACSALFILHGHNINSQPSTAHPICSRQHRPRHRHLSDAYQHESA